MIRIVALCSLMILSACASLGSKEVMIIQDDSEWKINDSDYFFACEKMSLRIEEILARLHIYSFGFILPIIPLGKIVDKTLENLSINLVLVDATNEGAYSDKDFTIRVFSGNEEIENISSEFKSHSYASISNGEPLTAYSIRKTFSKAIGKLDSLTLKIATPNPNCIPPVLHLELKDIDNHKFILSPGP